MKKLLLVSASALLAATAFSQSVNVYNWSDYIDEEVTIDGFSEKTGISLTYDVYDSNEILESKVSAGGSGYDVVVPTSDFLARGFEQGSYQELDLSRLDNLGNQDATIQAFRRPTGRRCEPWFGVHVGHHRYCLQRRRDC